MYFHFGWKQNIYFDPWESEVLPGAGTTQKWTGVSFLASLSTTQNALYTYITIEQE